MTKTIASLYAEKNRPALIKLAATLEDEDLRCAANSFATALAYAWIGADAAANRSERLAAMRIKLAEMRD